jgi:Sec-independent protein secretion pathway component TatC
LGGWVAYVYLLPLAWAFLTGFESRGSEVILQIHLEAKLSEYLPLALQMQLGLGLLFQYPLFLVSFLASGLICRKDMVQYRKVCFLLSFLVGACLSPPDLGAQCLIAFPLIFFYEGSLWGAGPSRKPSSQVVFFQLPRRSCLFHNAFPARVHRTRLLRKLLSYEPYFLSFLAKRRQNSLG